MKWVTFLLLLFVSDSAFSRGLFRRDAHKSEIAHRFKDLGEQHFKGLVLIAFSQFLQKCPYEEHVKLVNEVTDFAKTCVADESAENCDKSLHTLFGDKLCAIPTLRDSYGELADCCAKKEPERNECFLKHKDDHPNLPPFVRPDAEAMCTSFQENAVTFMGHYLHEVARRHPYFYAPELLYYAEKYSAIMTECCGEADKAACITPKLDALKEKALASSVNQRLKCSSLQRFGQRAFKAWAVARMSQKFPKADFAEITKLATDLTKLTEECCHGDLLECADDRAELAKYMCENQASISSKLQACCDKPVLKKSHCLSEVENDDLPADLPSLAADFVEDKEVCKNYAEAKDVFLGTFLYEYARRHPDYSVALLLRLAKKYEATLEKCCAEADPSACYGKVADLFIGHLCIRHEAKPLNPGIGHCCNSSYSNRRPCITSLVMDESYVPPPFSADKFTLNKDLCQAQGRALQTMKQELLVNLVKQKPDMTEEQHEAVTADFSSFLEKCCQDQEQEDCFAEEGPKLISRTRAALGV